ncbi:matrixin family metalloprotease [Streptomyces sp. NPDC020875]|uniref:matrixin family metalloprotease n=1 Tax=Streptomyces sp. NPDC020875 TaxID=3154898 RepID=UPI0033EB5F08
MFNGERGSRADRFSAFRRSRLTGALGAFAVAVSLVSFQGASAQAAGSGGSANCQLPPGPLSVIELPAGSSVIDCDAVGRVVEDGGVGLTVPEPGYGVEVSAVSVSGPPEHFEIQVSDAGIISYDLPSDGLTPAGGVDTPEPAPPVDEIPDTPPGTPDTPDGVADIPLPGATPIPDTDSAAAPGACSTSAFKSNGRKEYGTYKWYIGDGGMPAGLSRTDAKNAFADAINNITDGYNNCNIVSLVGPNASYQGTTTFEADINNKSQCTARDKKSTWDAGDLHNDHAAVTCSWFKSQPPALADVLEADVRYNTADTKFTNNPTSGCSEKIDIRSVGTHEAGHLFGLGHVTGNANVNQTMYWQSFWCSTAARTLARGDMNGLNYIY